ncbi:hypothetical protein GTA62_20570 [Roseobacter sp. HKCCD9010]|uniref:hypothetical protein n=1 Tax=unclassified Roseobacter TaxID=196798 RepID=UPI0014932660|nr:MULTISPECIES: hypothetical protein [unclassified Roseobacter]MBF9052390.1 hypothetical protein [Rhodobacterales bacterium HKCCD4356]NNV13719.1 hypothetical protein [Roseobacter sp. HKCCD7357]NNV18557.1 hypothetical protein [Roseobacter sp. HKCCD8768]NNV28008.1 hypothetical protein [Roseobacter sp. HKCCD8192]NNV32308.1 hypothetical protein [Roseobacter sp. HKCCD9061]
MNSSVFTVAANADAWVLIGPDQNGPIIRITSAMDDQSKMEFAQFGITAVPNRLVFRALEIVAASFFGPAPGMRLIFRDILAGSRAEARLTQYELIARHDHILNVIKLFGRSQGLRVCNSFLDIRRGSFDTLIDLA